MKSVIFPAILLAITLSILSSPLFAQTVDTTSIIGEKASQEFEAKVRDYARTTMPTTSHGLEFDESLRPFYHGVASGDPLPDRVILWTRITPEKDQTIDVIWKIATDPELQQVVNTGSVITDQSHDYTVKVDATNLQPGTTYYYGFTAFGRNSLTGRTKTAPAGPVNQLRFAVASCSNYQQGYFNAYANMAKRDDLDAVLFLGDYIYEYEEGGYGYSDEVGRGHEPDNEIVTLDDYRIRHSYYKLDPDLRRLHQQVPFIAVWDDHESTNDSYKNGAENHQPETEGDWEVRKANSINAYFEWMPIREVPENESKKVYRTFRYGDLADIIMIDTRLEGREKQAEDEDDPELMDPDRTILGKEQFDWLTEQLTESTAQWKIIGNQVMMAQLQGFVNLDAWDGYPTERDRLLELIEKQKLDNVVLVTGDIHSSWASDISRNPYDPEVYDWETGRGALAVEFVTTSISSANFNEINGQPPRNPGSIATEAALKAGNKHLKFVEVDSHGYIVVDVTPQQVQADWFYADTILVRKPGEHFAAGFFVADKENHLSPSTTPAPEKTVTPKPAPILPPGTITDVQDKDSVADKGFAVVGNYPNPFGKATLINYMVSEEQPITAGVYNQSGSRVAVLLDGKPHEAGVYSIEFDGSTLPSGTYYYKIEGNDGVALTRKMTLHKTN